MYIGIVAKGQHDGGTVIPSFLTNGRWGQHAGPVFYDRTGYGARYMDTELNKKSQLASQADLDFFHFYWQIIIFHNILYNI